MNVRGAVVIREVGPREALQATREVLPTELKAELIRGLIRAGFVKVNAVSLVHPKAMPQMADAEDVLGLIGPDPGATLSALAPNEKAVQRAIALSQQRLLGEVLLIHAMSPAVLSANGINRGTSEHLEEILRLAEAASGAGLRVAVFISAAFGCSVLGRIEQEDVLSVADRLRASDYVDELVISDSTGQADPAQVSEMFAGLAARVGSFPVTAHFHDSRGAGLANILAVLDSPIATLTLDSAIGGLGGDVPFLPEASGNISTEDLLLMLAGMGVRAGIDVEAAFAVSRRFFEMTGWKWNSRSLDVGPVPWKTVAAHVG